MISRPRRKEDEKLFSSTLRLGVSFSADALSALQKRLDCSGPGVDIGGQEKVRYDTDPLSSCVGDLGKIRLLNAANAEYRYFDLRPEVLQVAQANRGRFRFGGRWKNRAVTNVVGAFGLGGKRLLEGVGRLSNNYRPTG
jgi:hypothetical protein